MKAEIIKEKCPAISDLCHPLKECPLQAIFYVEDINEPMGGRILVDNSKCDGCAICIDLCCGQAIIMN